MNNINYYFDRFIDRISQQSKDNFSFRSGKTRAYSANRNSYEYRLQNLSLTYFNKIKSLRGKGYTQIHTRLDRLDVQDLYFYTQITLSMYEYEIDLIERYIIKMSKDKEFEGNNYEVFGKITKLKEQKNKITKAKDGYRDSYLKVLAKSMEYLVNNTNKFHFVYDVYAS